MRSSVLSHRGFHSFVISFIIFYASTLHNNVASLCITSAVTDIIDIETRYVRFLQKLIAQNDKRRDVHVISGPYRHGRQSPVVLVVCCAPEPLCAGHALIDVRRSSDGSWSTCE